MNSIIIIILGFSVGYIAISFLFNRFQGKGKREINHSNQSSSNQTPIDDFFAINTHLIKSVEADTESSIDSIKQFCLLNFGKSYSVRKVQSKLDSYKHSVIPLEYYAKKLKAFYGDDSDMLDKLLIHLEYISKMGLSSSRGEAIIVVLYKLFSIPRKQNDRKNYSNR